MIQYDVRISSGHALKMVQKVRPSAYLVSVRCAERSGGGYRQQFDGSGGVAEDVGHFLCHGFLHFTLQILKTNKHGKKSLPVT